MPLRAAGWQASCRCCVCRQAAVVLGAPTSTPLLAAHIFPPRLAYLISEQCFYSLADPALPSTRGPPRGSTRASPTGWRRSPWTASTPPRSPVSLGLGSRGTGQGIPNRVRSNTNLFSFFPRCGSRVEPNEGRGSAWRQVPGGGPGRRHCFRRRKLSPAIELGPEEAVQRRLRGRGGGSRTDPPAIQGGPAADARRGPPGEWQLWQQFVSRDQQAALRLDSLRSSHPPRASLGPTPPRRGNFGSGPPLFPPQPITADPPPGGGSSNNSSFCRLDRQKISVQNADKFLKRGAKRAKNGHVWPVWGVFTPNSG